MNLPPRLITLIDTPGFGETNEFHYSVQFVRLLLEAFAAIIRNRYNYFGDEQNTEKQKPQHLKEKPIVILKKMNERSRKNSLYNFRKKKLHR